jgi:hypothetical protein
MTLEFEIVARRCRRVFVVCCALSNAIVEAACFDRAGRCSSMAALSNQAPRSLVAGFRVPSGTRVTGEL